MGVLFRQIFVEVFEAFRVLSPGFPLGAKVRSEDCGTTEGVSVAFKKRKPAEANFADKIRGRVLADDVLHPKTQAVMFPKG